MIIATGRLVSLKGLSSLIRAFAKVHTKIPEARLMLIGDGPEKNRLLEEVRELNVESFVEFAGLVESLKLSSLYEKAWLFVQASIGYESFSISTLEALSSGLTALVSSQVGIAEWFQGKDAIEIFKEGDVNELADKIGRLLAEPWEKNRERGYKARAIVEAEFSADRVVKQIEALCSE